MHLIKCIKSVGKSAKANKFFLGGFPDAEEESDSTASTSVRHHCSCCCPVAERDDQGCRGAGEVSTVTMFGFEIPLVICVLLRLDVADDL
jgi:hypothetical protein